MKITYKVYILLFIIAITVGCSSSSATYEKAIADYVQRDKRGIWTDLQFKALETEVTERTVADSMAILLADFEVKKTKMIEAEQKNRDYWQEQITDKVSVRDAALYRSRIAVIEGRIDSLEKLLPATVERYKDVSPDKLLGIIVKCHYSYVLPGKEARQERTEIFVLSTDGKKVMGKEK